MSSRCKSNPKEKSNHLLINPRRPDEFMDYNCTYRGVRDWEDKRSMLAITAGIQSVAAA